MKTLIFMVNRETGKLASYKIYNYSTEEMQKKIEAYNNESHNTEAKIITDELTVEALEMKESTETVRSVTDNLIEEFQDLRNTISNALNGVEYMMDDVKKRVDNISTVSQNSI